MLQLPANLTAEQFLARHWQKKPLYMPKAAAAMRPTVTRNELAWLATLDDVESRIVFTDRDGKTVRYRMENGPFESEFLQALPPRDWTLLVHDVDKHLPAMRKLFQLVPFIPDWRIDDLMISFAAPGGGVGPHRDNYDVFLCQGIGARDWQFTTEDVAIDASASDDLCLLQPFEGAERHLCRRGDVLYLPPEIAHWGTAQRACITYSIGMRAPPNFADPDLQCSEVRPGYISPAAIERAGGRATELGCQVTRTKEWLRPVAPTDEEIRALLEHLPALFGLQLHGMARIAFDDKYLYANGEKRVLDESDKQSVAALCARRRLDKILLADLGTDCLSWLLACGTFDLPEKSGPYVN